MVNLKEKLTMDFPGLFDKESEVAQRKRDQWDRLPFPEPSIDPKNRNTVKFMIYSPFEERKGSLTDKDGKVLPLYALKVINFDGLSKQTIMSGESVVRSLVADIINNDILLDDDMNNISGLAYNVETIVMKGDKNKVYNEEKKVWEQKRFHKFVLDKDKSLPEEDRNKDGVEKYIVYMREQRKNEKEQETKDKEAKDKGVPTEASVDSQKMFGELVKPGVITEVQPPTEPSINTGN